MEARLTTTKTTMHWGTPLNNLWIPTVARIGGKGQKLQLLWEFLITKTTKCCDNSQSNPQKSQSLHLIPPANHFSYFLDQSIYIIKGAWGGRLVVGSWFSGRRCRRQGASIETSHFQSM